MRDWVTNVADSYYLLGSVLGPAPLPADGARVPVGDRPGGAARSASTPIGRLPDAIVACVGGGSNAMGIFDAFIADASGRLIGVEAGGDGIAPGRARRALRRRQLRACCRARAATCCRTRTATSS